MVDTFLLEDGSGDSIILEDGNNLLLQLQETVTTFTIDAVLATRQTLTFTIDAFIGVVQQGVFEFESVIKDLFRFESTMS